MTEEHGNEAEHEAEAGKRKRSKSARLRLKRAYWPEEDKRVNEGTEFDVTDMDEALRLVEEGIAERA